MSRIKKTHQRKDAKVQRRQGFLAGRRFGRTIGFSRKLHFAPLPLCAFALARQIGLSLILVTVLLPLSGCNKTEQLQTAATDAGKSETKTTEPTKDSNLLTLSAESVKLAKLEFAEATETEIIAPIEATGRVTINEDLTARVGSLFSGRILEVHAKVGDVVRKGQVLAKMHTHEVHEAEAEWFKAQAELKQRQTLIKTF